MVDQSEWIKITKSNPNHSAAYIERFKLMADAGKDLVGEARLVDAMAPRRARILDAGCGPGRVGTFLSELGHEVVGVDVDPELIAAAELASSGPIWLVSDLAELDLAAHGISDGFDVIVSAGNVMTFLARSTRREVLTRLCAHLLEDGRAVIGFGAGRGYDFDEFFSDAEAAGLDLLLKLSTWDLRPFRENSDFLVAVFGKIAS